MSLERTREERVTRLSEGTLHTFQLGPIAERMRREQEYSRNGRGGITLVKNPGLRVVLEVLRRGAALAEHTAPGPITVQVLEGEIRLQAGEEVVYLKQGELLTLPSRQPHSVEAVHDAVFLLTIAPEGRREPQE